MVILGSPDHPYRPFFRIVGYPVGIEAATASTQIITRALGQQKIIFFDQPAVIAAEPGRQVGRPAAHNRWHANTATDGDISSKAADGRFEC